MALGLRSMAQYDDSVNIILGGDVSTQTNVSFESLGYELYIWVPLYAE